jgi:hypothetical protein
MLYYPAQPAIELCLTIPGLPLGGCSTTERIAKLDLLERRINQTLVAEMLGTGELFGVTDQPAFTPYAGPAKCSKGGGSSSSSSSDASSSSSISYAPAPGGSNLTVQGTGAKNGARATAGTARGVLLLHAALLALAALLL